MGAHCRCCWVANSHQSPRPPARRRSARSGRRPPAPAPTLAPPWPSWPSASPSSSSFSRARAPPAPRAPCARALQPLSALAQPALRARDRRLSTSPHRWHKTEIEPCLFCRHLPRAERRLSASIPAICSARKCALKETQASRRLRQSAPACSALLAGPEPPCHKSLLPGAGTGRASRATSAQQQGCAFEAHPVQAASSHHRIASDNAAAGRMRNASLTAHPPPLHGDTATTETSTAQ